MNVSKSQIIILPGRGESTFIKFIKQGASDFRVRYSLSTKNKYEQSDYIEVTAGHLKYTNEVLSNAYSSDSSFTQGMCAYISGEYPVKFNNITYDVTINSDSSKNMFITTCNK